MLRCEPVPHDRSASVLRDWLRIHNLIIPTAPLSVDEVEERAGRSRLEVAYLGDTAVGCATVRASAGGISVVIARILPEHRRRGHGEQLYRRILATARDLGAESIGTVVLASNEDGLRFAARHGFVETERYLLPGDTVPFVDLTLSPAHEHIERFNAAVRGGDWSAFAAALHPAAVMTFPTASFTGRDAIAAAYRANPPDDTMTILAVRGEGGTETITFIWSRGGTGTLTIRRDAGLITQLVVDLD